MTERSSSRFAAVAADAVLALHFIISVFAVGGGFLILLAPLVALVHVPLVLWVGFVNLARRTCPLTPLEQNLRLAAGQQSYDTTWTRKYLEPVVRPLGMPRRLELVAGISTLIWNALVYTWVLYRL